MNRYFVLTKEQELILKLVNCNLNIEEIAEIEKFIKCSILNWDLVLIYAIHNRVLPIIYSNLRKYNLYNYIQSSIRKIMIIQYNNILEKNLDLVEECFRVIVKANEVGVEIIPLKGIALLLTYYNNFAYREMGDIDLLIREKDIPIVEKILKDCSYIQGDYCDGKIKQAFRSEILKRRMLTHELYEFVKISNRKSLDHFVIDVNFKFQWVADSKYNRENHFDTSIAFENCSSAQFNGVNYLKLKTEIQFMHLCAHLYNEAVHFLWDKRWRYKLTEISIFRFLDIYLLLEKDAINWEEVKILSKMTNLDKPVNYVLCGIKILFDKEYIESSELDFSSLDVFCDLDGNFRCWETPFIKRLFKPYEKIDELIKRGFIKLED